MTGWAVKGKAARAARLPCRLALSAALMSVVVPASWAASAASRTAAEIPSQCPAGHEAYVLVTVEGLRDQVGNLRVEVYPDNNQDFLKNRLGRTEVPTPKGEPTLCVELPEEGRYAIVVHQDRDADNSFDVFGDGFGFSNNPELGFSAPDVDAVAISAGRALTHITVEMRYIVRDQARRLMGPQRR